MKLKAIVISLLMVSLAAHGQISLKISNSLPSIRKDELIIIPKEKVVKILDKLHPYIQVRKGGVLCGLQFDDLDGDGKWDEAVMLGSFRVRETITYEIISAKHPPSMNTTSRAHVRHKRKNPDEAFGPNLNRDSIPENSMNTDFNKVKLPPYLTEGPAWENDRVGFRLYFDVRNGKDIWGKTTEKMMMDSVGLDPLKIYHNRSDWGMDIYKVGSSLSAGALAINLNLAGKDSLIRLGGKNMGKVFYRKISDGPFRAKFRLFYPEWKYAEGAQAIGVVEDISIWGGQYFYSSEVYLINAPRSISLVTGFADIYQAASVDTTNSGIRVFYSYGMQSENRDNLGLCLMAKAQTVNSVGQVDSSGADIKNSFLFTFRQNPLQKYSFRFYSLWSASSRLFSKDKGVADYLHQQAHCYGDPLIYQWN